MKKLLLFLFVPLFFIFGCQAATTIISPIITGIVVWKDGEAHKYYSDELMVLHRAVKTSLKELNCPVTKEEVTKDGYYIVAGDSDRFRIIIRQVKPRVTEVGIRVNMLGDKPYADLMYKQIDLNTDTINFDEQGKPTKI